MKFTTHTLTLVLVFLIAVSLTACTPTPDETPSAPSPTPESTVQPTPYKDLIEVSTPIEGQTISSPLQIEGRARGTWFFEGTFPVVLTDFSGNTIAEGFASAEGEWMTEEYVPFSAELIFNPPEGVDKGTVLLQKANPSGLPENDDTLVISVQFR